MCNLTLSVQSISVDSVVMDVLATTMSLEKESAQSVLDNHIYLGVVWNVPGGCNSGDGAEALLPSQSGVRLLTSGSPGTQEVWIRRNGESHTLYWISLFEANLLWILDNVCKE